mmetsp:Transcript_12260/g.35224  ORF Transcript_12260/g.35224 Transcript_12260/m.35224 type:complete len:243 (+) Transcript_12260:1513-2241(+)
MVYADDLQGGEHAPQEQVFAPGGDATDWVQVPALAQGLLADWARHDPVWSSRLCPLSPSLALRVLVEPLGDAVAAEQVRAARELRAAPRDMDLANLADEFLGLGEELVLLNLDLVRLLLLLRLHTAERLVHRRRDDLGVRSSSRCSLSHGPTHSARGLVLLLLLLVLLLILVPLVLLLRLFRLLLDIVARLGGDALLRGRLRRSQCLLLVLGEVETVVHGVVVIIGALQVVLHVVLNTGEVA